MVTSWCIFDHFQCFVCLQPNKWHFHRKEATKRPSLEPCGKWVQFFQLAKRFISEWETTFQNQFPAVEVQPWLSGLEGFAFALGVLIKCCYLRPSLESVTAGTLSSYRVGCRIESSHAILQLPIFIDSRKLIDLRLCQIFVWCEWDEFSAHVSESKEAASNDHSPEDPGFDLGIWESSRHSQKVKSVLSGTQWKHLYWVRSWQIQLG